MALEKSFWGWNTIHQQAKLFLFFFFLMFISRTVLVFTPVIILSGQIIVLRVISPLNFVLTYLSVSGTSTLVHLKTKAWNKLDTVAVMHLSLSETSPKISILVINYRYSPLVIFVICVCVYMSAFIYFFSICICLRYERFKMMNLPGGGYLNYWGGGGSRIMFVRAN